MCLKKVICLNSGLVFEIFFDFLENTFFDEKKESLSTRVKLILIFHIIIFFFNNILLTKKGIVLVRMNVVEKNAFYRLAVKSRSILHLGRTKK